MAGSLSIGTKHYHMPPRSPGRVRSVPAPAARDAHAHQEALSTAVHPEHHLGMEWHSRLGLDGQPHAVDQIAVLTG